MNKQIYILAIVEKTAFIVSLMSQAVFIESVCTLNV